jgi:hypothetical protein
VPSIRGANTLLQSGKEYKPDRSKEPIRDSMSGADKPRFRAATKKPAIRGPTKIKNQRGSEDAFILVQVIVVTTSEVVNETK